MLGFRTKALDDAGAYLRYEPLGGVIWAQVTPGCYRWQNVRVEFTQVLTNKAPCSPNRGYSRMQHLWFTERVMDIVAHELELDPVEVRKRNYVRAEDMPYTTPERLRLRLGRLRADARRRARAHRPRRRRGAAARRRVPREAVRLRDRLDARLRHEQLRPVAADQPRAAVLREQRGGLGQARHLRRGRRHARDDAAGAGPRDDRRDGRGRHHRGHARRRERPRRARQLLELARRLLGHLREPVRGHGPRRGQGRRRPARRRDQEARLGHPRLRGRRPRARRGARPHEGEPGGGPAADGLRRDHQRQQRRAARGPRRDAERALRLPAELPGARRRDEVRQPDAHLRGAGACRRRRGRPRDGRRTRSSTTRPWTTAAPGSTRRSWRGR